MRLIRADRQAGVTTALAQWVRDGEVYSAGKIDPKYTRVIIVSTQLEVKNALKAHKLNWQQVRSVHSWMSSGGAGHYGVNVAFDNLEAILSVIAGGGMPDVVTLGTSAEEFNGAI